MGRLTIPHYLVLGAGLAAIVLLGFGATTPGAGSRFMKTETAMAGNTDHEHDAESRPIDVQLKEARKRFPQDLLRKVESLEGLISTDRDAARRSMAYDSLSVLLGRSNEVVAAAWYQQQKAEKNNGSGNDWAKAGERWWASVRFVKNEADHPALYESALHCFTKALELDPGSIPAKVGMGVCYVEATSEPMKGITLLKEVLEKDSTNVDALMNLGLFAERSQQYDKAVERYAAILRHHPEYISMWLKLAEVYETTGNVNGTIQCLEKYLELENDPVMRNDIENYLNKLKKQNTNQKN